MAPLYLGIKAVLVKSFARIHRANLINAGIVPLVFSNPGDYDHIQELDSLVIEGLKEKVQSGHSIQVKNLTQNQKYEVECTLTNKEINVLLAGGKINLIRRK